MNQDDIDTMREEYDFSERVRGKHHEAYRRGTSVVVLEPDVAKVQGLCGSETGHYEPSRKWRGPMCAALQAKGRPDRRTS